MFCEKLRITPDGEPGWMKGIGVQGGQEVNRTVLLLPRRF